MDISRDYLCREIKTEVWISDFGTRFQGKNNKIVSSTRGRFVIVTIRFGLILNLQAHLNFTPDFQRLPIFFNVSEKQPMQSFVEKSKDVFYWLTTNALKSRNIIRLEKVSFLVSIKYSITLLHSPLANSNIDLELESLLRKKVVIIG